MLQKANRCQHFWSYWNKNHRKCLINLKRASMKLSSLILYMKYWKQKVTSKLKYFNHTFGFFSSLALLT